MDISSYFQCSWCRRGARGSVWTRVALYRTDVISDLSDGQSPVDIYGGIKYDQLPCYLFYRVWGCRVGCLVAHLSAQNTGEDAMTFDGV